MKRDMDLVRNILFELEKLEHDGRWVDLKIVGVAELTMTEHIRLMAEADLIDAIDLSSMSGPNWKPKRITWHGHEFLDLIRSQTIWEKAKTIVKEKTGGLAIEALETCARYLIAQAVAALGGGTGSGG